VNYQVLRKLVSLSIDTRTAPHLRDQAFEVVMSLIPTLEQLRDNAADRGYKAHYQGLMKMAVMLRDEPEQIQLPSTPSAPPGAPIGMDAWCGN
jgi:hypothetical protein